MHLQVKNTFKNNFYHTFKQTCNRIEREEEHHENNELTNPSSPPPSPPPSVSPSLPFCSLWVYCLLSSRFGKLPKLFPLNPLYNLQIGTHRIQLTPSSIRALGLWIREMALNI